MNKLYIIQYLRGFAACLVAYFHIVNEINKYSKESIVYNFFDFKYFGNIGVDIFFVISGFIMIYIHNEDFQKKGILLHFLKKRIIRVVPLYWMLTIIAAILLYVSPNIFGGGKEFDITHFFASLFFVPYENSIGLVLPIIGPGWSLNFEMYFYLVFAIFLRLPRNKFVMYLTSFFLLSTLLLALPNRNPIISMISSPIIFEFLFGIIIGKLYLHKYLLNYSWLLLLGFILVFLNVIKHFDMEYRIIVYGIPSAILIYGAVSFEYFHKIHKPNKLLLFLGNISYSLYLSHVFSYKLLLKLTPVSVIQNSPDLMALLTLFFTILIGAISYKLIEVYLTNTLKSTFK